MLKKVAKYYWWCQIGGWLSWALVNILVLSFYFKSFRTEILINQLFFVVVGIGVTHLLRTIIVSFNWLQYPLDKVMIPLFVLAIAGSAMITVILGILNMFFHFDRDRGFFELQRFFGSSFLVVIWTMVYFLWHYFQKDQQYKIDRLQLESVVKGLELRTIKSQLNPHFIFNALNSIRALVDENPKRARTAITELSNILRSSMQVEQSETVSMEHELSIVKDYLALESIRFEERLKIQYDIEPQTLELAIPPMMLQTLVENAIKHGISKSVKGGVVNIRSRINGMLHEITIQNTGHLKITAGKNEGFGLQSTRQRLELLYKEKASFQITEPENNLVESRILIPL